MCRIFVGLMAAWIALATVPVYANTVSYYVGVDGRTAPLTAPTAEGGGAYPSNPNLGRLTLLLHHGDHFHGIGAYSYSGPAATPQLNDTNTNNRLPEISTGLPAISLLPGTGGWAGTFRTGIPSTSAQDVEYGQLELRNVHSLMTEDPTTYNSSSGRWNGQFANAHIHLELVSKTPGLGIAFGANPLDQLVKPGDDWHVGDGNQMFSFTPTFWVTGATPVGSKYQAELRLTDLEDPTRNSGRFTLDLVVVPEPATGAWLGLALLGIVRRRPR